MNLPIHAERPGKLTHAQTILYEIDMLRLAADDLTQESEWNSWRNLECFLLHFRNLIEFFGKPISRDSDTLSIRRPEKIWEQPETQPSNEQLSRLRCEDLWNKYEERRKGEINDKISRYLKHCTEQRVVDKRWNVGEMFEEIRSVIAEFEKLLPNKHRPWGELPRALLHSCPTLRPLQRGSKSDFQIELPGSFL